MLSTMASSSMKKRTLNSTGCFLDPKKVVFSMFSSDEIRKMSAVKVVNPLTLNTLGHPVPGGLYDPAMGPLSSTSEPCTTCLKTVYGCPGHMGHIELPFPVVNPLFHKPVAVLMKLSCLECHRLQIDPVVKWQSYAQLKLAEQGFVAEALDIALSTPTGHSKADGDEKEFLSFEVKDVYMKQTVAEYVKKVTGGVSQQSQSQAAETVLNSIQNQIFTYSLAQESERLKEDSTISKGKNRCKFCTSPLKKISIYKDRLSRIEVAPKHQQCDESAVGSSSSVLKVKTCMQTFNPKEIRDHLRLLWDNEKEFIAATMPVLKNRSMSYPTDMFFMDVIPVPPINVRPINFIRGKALENPQSPIYKKLISDSLVLWNVIHMMQEESSDKLTVENKMLVNAAQGTAPEEKLHFVWEELQRSADRLLDSDHFSNDLASARVQGLKQLLEKKEGVIRMNMMGKRVNYAARSVITPDPNLNVDEIGFPEAFAMKLTYPVPVTPWNVIALHQMVINGPNIHPGAVMVENESGHISRLSADNPLRREAIANRLLTPGNSTETYGVKKVYRHLLNGDILLLNRQPTLHRPSIMAHKARILKGEKTLRMHYSNCKAYNADFDGDEMNAHFPQSELARSEAYNLANVCHQYLVPKNGTPLGGLIQDHMVSGVHLSVRGKFFSREDYLQLIYQAVSYLPGNLKLLPPAIMKPMQLWSGKQVISTVLINTIPAGSKLINLTDRAKIPAYAWEQRKPRPWKAGGTPLKDNQSMSEAEVVIREGELLCGVLDKTHVGASSYGLVHCVYELYGGEYSSRLLSSFSKLFMAFLQLMQGFTLGVEDILVLKEADSHRFEIMKECRNVGDNVAADALGLPQDTPPEIITQKIQEAYNNPKLNFRDEIDRQYKSVLNSFTDRINKTCLPAGLLQKFPQNNLQLMVQSGAKGSTVNTMQISCLLGQIELEGKRPPLMISGRSLPSFAPYDRQPRAGGFIDGRFMTGIQPQEFFFHCMAGREGLIDTAVKTSRSGYLQRCLVKNLEGLNVHYDMTVRDSDGSVIQFAYGEDGMDVLKAQFLKASQLPFLEDNQEVICNQNLLSTLKNDERSKEIRKQKKAIKKWRSVNKDCTVTRMSPFIRYSAAMKDALSSASIVKKTGRRKGIKQLIELFRSAPKSDPEMKAFHDIRKCPDPVTAAFPACAHFGVLTEHLEGIVNEYLSRRPDKINSGIDKNGFKDLIYLKSMSSLAPSGEPVGLLAAQSVGEPSTQMTLNTFHFAGRGEMNVTLGIPRLKEILMTASKSIRTPSMEIPFRSGIRNLEKRAENVKQMVTKVTVADVLEYIHVTESLALQPGVAHLYELKMQFLPFKSYKHKLYVTPASILKHIERQYFRFLEEHIRKLTEQSKSYSSLETDVKAVGKTRVLKKEDEDFDPQDNLLSLASKSGTGEEHESSDEDAEADDEDATAVRSRMRHMDSGNYSDESAQDDSDHDFDEEDGDVGETNEINTGNVHFHDKSIAETANRIRSTLQKRLFIKEYSYDTKGEEWCIVKLKLPVKFKKINLASALRETAIQSAVWEVPGLKRGFLVQHPQNGLTLKTDGQNIHEMAKFHNILDLDKLYSNDIHAVARTYGIEAAGRVIVKEIKDVFEVYGITVDPRHLMLISDFMTSSGEFLPLSRTGINNNPSALQKMSFESSIGFLKKAVWRGKADTLQSPSSRICIGKLCKNGTGSVHLRHQLLT